MHREDCKQWPGTEYQVYFGFSPYRIEPCISVSYSNLKDIIWILTASATSFSAFERLVIISLKLTMMLPKLAMMDKTLQIWAGDKAVWPVLLMFGMARNAMFAFKSMVDWNQTINIKSQIMQSSQDRHRGSDQSTHHVIFGWIPSKPACWW